MESLGMGSVQEQNYRNMKDFLQLYNKLTQQCFERCVYDFNQKKLRDEEVKCMNVCADRYVGYNQRLMLTFMEMQNAKQDAAIKEIEKAAAAQSASSPTADSVLPSDTAGLQTTPTTPDSASDKR